MYYYHRWLLEIPHLSFVAVPQLSGDVFRLSMANENNKKRGQDEDNDDDDDDANSTSNSDGSINSSDEVFTIVSPPPPWTCSAQRKHNNTACASTGRSVTLTGQDTSKMRLLQSHLQESLEKSQHWKNKGEREQQVALTIELKAVEELRVMKKSDLKAFDSDVDSESEKVFVCQQI